MKHLSKALKKLSGNWLDNIDPQEVEQEELIQAWKNPDVDGYQGFYAYRTLLLNKCKEETIQEFNEELKKSTPDKSSGVLSFKFILEDYLLSIPEEDRGLFCIVIQPHLQKMYYGRDIETIDKQSEHIGASRSSLGRLLKNYRERLSMHHSL